MEATENYIMFELAERLGYTVRELLQRMDSLEFALWARFFQARARIEQQNRKRAGRSG